ncbi:MAG: hypothetical protein JXO22_05350, partial [Phycisphaerae bacterium]|nr:hypothetical protein [Phycisphaerae bacterium]
LLSGDSYGNQYGGDLESAYEKITGDRFTELTPDEVQYYYDAAATADEDLDYDVDDAVADAVVTFFRDHSLDSAAAVSVYIDDPANDVLPDIPDGFLQDVFVDFDPIEVEDQLP